MAAGGAQQLFGVPPDLTTLGKILGGGLPVGRLRRAARPDGADGAVGPRVPGGHALGKPARDERRASRCSRRSRAILPTTELERKGALLEAGVREAIAEAGVADRVSYERVGSLSTLFFAPGPFSDFASVKSCDTAAYSRFFHAMRKRGVSLPPAQFEAWFVSTAHSESDLRSTAKAVGESLAAAFRS